MQRIDQDHQKLSKFLTQFKILQQTEQSTIIASNQNTFLIKNIQIDQKQCQLPLSRNFKPSKQFQEMLQALAQHQQFDSKFILPLMSYEVVNQKSEQNNKDSTYIRAIYQYGQKTLHSQIIKRKFSQAYFDEDQIWVLLSSLAHPLNYLQSQNVIYGVLDVERIFIDNKIKLLDPSCTGINPYQLQQGRLYSPQILQIHDQSPEEINMFKSDVFVLGIIIIQATILNVQILQFSQQDIQEYFEEIQTRYSTQLCRLIRSLVHQYPQQRPSFQQILDQMSQMFEFSQETVQILDPLHADVEDKVGQICYMQEGRQHQVHDVLFDEQSYNYQQMSQYQMAKQRYLCSPQKVEESRLINQNNESIILTSNSFIMQQTSIVNSDEKTKRQYKTKKIKQNIVKFDIQNDMQSFVNYQNEPRNMNINRKSNSTKKKNGLSNEFLANKQNLLTNPQILKMIRDCRKQIQAKSKGKHSRNNSNVSEARQNYHACM